MYQYLYENLKAYEILRGMVFPPTFFLPFCHKNSFFLQYRHYFTDILSLYIQLLYTLLKYFLPFFLERKLIRVILDNIINITMQLITNKYQTQLISSLIINNLHYNFIILNNKLIFTHSLNNKQIKDLNKLLKSHYYKYKLV